MDLNKQELLFYKKAVNLGNYGITQYNIHENKVIISDTGIKILGLTKQSAYNIQTIKKALLIEERSAFDSILDKLNTLPDINKFHIKIHKPVDAESTEIRSIHVTLNLEKRNEGIPESIFAVFEDVTDRKRIEKDLNRSREKALESEKLKTAFLVNMSHEIRNPMNAIIGFSELMNIGNPSYESRKEWASLIKKKGKQLLSLIDDVIEVSKLETGKINISKTKCDLNQLIRETKAVYDRVKHEKGKAHLNIRTSVPAVSVITYNDYGRLTQILNNLLNNSIQFTDKGYIEFGYKTDNNGKIIFFVKDTGIGMSAEEQNIIFDRFKHTEETIAKKYAGSGLGLTISKALVHFLGGRIHVESTVGEGSVFHFNIPYQDVPERADILKTADLQIETYNWKNKVILVVEDEDVNYIFLESLLHDTQARLLRAHDGQQAVELAKSIHKIDLILMDIKMPKKDGYRTTREIREFNNKVKIIAQTAFAFQEDVNKCYDAGCNDFISKPLDIKLLIDKIDKAFNN